MDHKQKPISTVTAERRKLCKRVGNDKVAVQIVEKLITIEARSVAEFVGEDNKERR